MKPQLDQTDEILYKNEETQNLLTKQFVKSLNHISNL